MRKIYDYNSEEYIEIPNKMNLFLLEIEEVCKKYGLSIGHEDPEGSFVIQEYNDSNINGLKYAGKDY
ncbi:hypothetical protein [Clostridium sp. L74]|uniref:hypothetical protein n=1 Tax=Clostridium sp. L74 TaxID=1560217 RepID=UPI0006AB9EF6|nr:hypothetical protein [Clostridium sp. L74]KOR25011.1 hypothetical protein ND00_20770 [Clostridium sp. L74]